ncbi:polysaccharide deacetylase [Bacillus nakamurai]|uniref:Polysaccharide deacetylase n=1 Tax=Bacillus nakamurai TaxID=1793963 RepID=A0A150F8G7_9BACI|nr:polysaccharide deacetylase family protein [Bacillus nakamurai]KXZ20786.1 polysaccharide deacetylase [Bacillus nakamurai]KXZ23988.1 polysaccharide deacetylase [Bacillus nakamurai]MCC9022601.1 polysaccharide deacetylase [Bacillus nakamurai]MED1227022.1 polysaccharide deacetylase [Bacillus nakamurai]
MRKTKEGASPSLFSLAFKLTSLAVLCGLLLLIVILGYSTSASKGKQITVTANGQLRNEKQSLRLKDDSPDVLIKHLQGERDTGKKTVYLTFDDGPSPYTDRLLDVLKAHGAKATFFMLAPRMNEYKHSVQRAKQEGIALGLHGVTHDNKLFYQTPTSPLKEMQQGRATLQAITGVKTDLVRTPYGSKPSLTDAQIKNLEKGGFVYWDWTIDSEDWKYKNAQYVPEVLNQLAYLESSHTSRPLVILMHDLPATVHALPSLIQQLKAKGYSFDVLTDQMIPVHE